MARYSGKSVAIASVRIGVWGFVSVGGSSRSGPRKERDSILVCAKVWKAVAGEAWPIRLVLGKFCARDCQADFCRSVSVRHRRTVLAKMDCCERRAAERFGRRYHD